MNISRNLRRRLVGTALGLVPVLACATQAWAEPATTPTTAPDALLLPHDPANITGQFPNGLHYLIRRTSNPPGKVFLNLAVRTGSLNETADQNGLAHFLEHMAFKGSTHYAPTKLIPMLTHLGMQFGADTNAHTNQYETVFKLAMPNTNPETTALALTIFSDYANGLSLFPIQIESERRVILEEIRSRRNVGLRIHKQMNNILYPGSTMAIHDVLGDSEIIKNAKSPLFIDYWNKWYRPEKMTLVVVGDIDPDAIIAQAAPLLGTFTARAPEQVPVKAGLKPFDAPRAAVITDPEQVTGDVEMVSLQPVRPILTTVVQYRRQLLESIGRAIVNRRLANLITNGKSAFQSAEVGGGDILHDGYQIEAGAEGEPKDWQKSLEELITEVKRADDHGFSQQELNLTRDALLSGATRAVKTESTRDSRELVAAITQAVDTDQPMISSRQELELLQQLLAGISLDELQSAFTADFKTNNYAYVVILPPAGVGQSLPSEKEVLAVATTAWQQNTLANTEIAAATSILPTEPTAGEVASTTIDADLGLTTIVFKNGVVMHHRFSDYKKDQVLIKAILPGGNLEETAANHGISRVASLILARPATSHLSSQQIRDLLSDKNVAVSGGIGMDSLAIDVSGSPADIPLGMELVNAILTDAKLEQPAVDEWKKSELQSLRAKPKLAEPQLADAVASTLMGGDPRFTALTTEIVNRQDREGAEAWFKHIANHSAIEVSVVGDISTKDAIALVGKYLGSLPTRTGKFSDLDALRHFSRAAGPYEKTVYYQAVEPKALVMAGFVGCDELDPERRPLSLASLILTERMIHRIRFDQQIVYSIGCRSTPSHGLPGAGLVTVSTPTDPKNAKLLADTILGIIKDLATNGPTEDELVTAKKQMANQLGVQMKTPDFWIIQIAELKYHGRSLEDLKQLPAIYQTYTVDQVHDVVRKYASEDHLIRLDVLPQQQNTAE